MEAAKSIRDGRTADVANLFHRVGGRHDETMSFMAEMIIPGLGADDLGQKAEATITFLRYSVELGLRKAEGSVTAGGLVLCKEELEHINITNASQHLLFPSTKEWRQSALRGRRTVPFISTSDHAIIQLHQDRGGRVAAVPPRSALVTTPDGPLLGERRGKPHGRARASGNAIVASVAARTRCAPRARHLRDPSPARERRLTSRGLALPSRPRRRGTLGRAFETRRRARSEDDLRPGRQPPQRPHRRRPGGGCRSRFATRTLDTLRRGKDGTKHPARALSDGTLRFLALAVIELDPAAQGVLCLEEPENGIHPERIPAMLRLLKEIATVTDDPIGPDNPLRQVIINTHSPAVVSEVDEESLLFAQLHEDVRDGQRFQSVQFAALSGTWRAKGNDPAKEVRKGDILVYLSGPRPAHEPDPEAETPASPNGRSSPTKAIRKSRRVIDRDDLQRLLHFGEDPD